MARPARVSPVLSSPLSTVPWWTLRGEHALHAHHTCVSFSPSVARVLQCIPPAMQPSVSARRLHLVPSSSSSERATLEIYTLRRFQRCAVARFSPRKCLDAAAYDPIFSRGLCPRAPDVMTHIKKLSWPDSIPKCTTSAHHDPMAHLRVLVIQTFKSTVPWKGAFAWHLLQRTCATKPSHVFRCNTPQIQNAKDEMIRDMQTPIPEPRAASSSAPHLCASAIWDRHRQHALPPGARAAPN